MTETIKVTGLTIYPVKSFAGIDLQKSEIDSMGLKYDRRWMVVATDGLFITQRTHPQMVLIQPSIKDGQLVLRKEGLRDCVVPAVNNDSEKMDVVVWNDRLTVQKTSKEVDAWLQQAIGIQSHLVYISDDVFRQCDLEFSKQGEQTGFADGFPMLFISEASLTDLNERLKDKVDMRRFRPNVVIDGCNAYAEDELENFQVGDMRMRGVKPCSRCPMPTVDPDKGQRAGQEPIATLSTYRKRDGKVYFGMNVIHEQQGVIRVGDELIINN